VRSSHVFPSAFAVAAPADGAVTRRLRFAFAAAPAVASRRLLATARFLSASSFSMRVEPSEERSAIHRVALCDARRGLQFARLGLCAACLFRRPNGIRSGLLETERKRVDADRAITK
jgi:hypothetical protein